MVQCRLPTPVWTTLAVKCICLKSLLAEQVKITELEDFAQLAFEGYKTLNRIQSRIFHTAFNSNENILVSIFRRYVDSVFTILK